MGWPILSIVTFLPALGALLILVVCGDDAAATRNIRVMLPSRLACRERIPCAPAESSDILLMRNRGG